MPLVKHWDKSHEPPYPNHKLPYLKRCTIWCHSPHYTHCCRRLDHAERIICLQLKPGTPEKKELLCGIIMPAWVTQACCRATEFHHPNKICTCVAGGQAIRRCAKSRHICLHAPPYVTVIAIHQEVCGMMYSVLRAAHRDTDAQQSWHAVLVAL